jgi:CBS domain-containing protein
MNYKLIHIFTSEEVRFQGKPLQDAVVEFVRRLKTAARCTVTRADAGCYESGEVATRKLEILSFNMPVLIEIVLPESELSLVLPHIEEMVSDGIVGVESLEVVVHRTRKHLIPRQIRVRDVMTPSPKTVAPTASAAEVVRLLLSGDFNGVPVIDAEARPIGIITQGDLIERAGMPVRLGLLEEFERHHLDELLSALEKRSVREIMTQPAVTIGEDKPLIEAVNLMLSKRLKRLPVINAQGQLVGILARLDVFHTVTHEAPDWKAIEGRNVAVSDLRYVRDIMRRDTHAVLPETSIDEVIRLIDDNDIQRVAVVDTQGNFLGLVSDRDLLNAFSAHKAGLWDRLASKLSFTELGQRHKAFLEQSRKTTAAQVMKTDLVTVREETTIDEAVRLMIGQKIKRLPVLDEQGKFKGLVSRDSLLRAGMAQGDIAK